MVRKNRKRETKGLIDFPLELITMIFCFLGFDLYSIAYSCKRFHDTVMRYLIRFTSERDVSRLHLYACGKGWLSVLKDLHERTFTRQHIQKLTIQEGLFQSIVNKRFDTFRFLIEVNLEAGKEDPSKNPNVLRLLSKVIKQDFNDSLGILDSPTFLWFMRNSSKIYPLILSGIKTSCDHNPIEIACKQGNVRMVKKLVLTFPILVDYNAQDNFMAASPISVSVDMGSIKMTKILLKANAKRYPHMLDTAIYRRDVKMFRTLCNHSSGVVVKTPRDHLEVMRKCGLISGTGFLQKAFKSRSTEIIDFLIEIGYDDPLGQHPMTICSQFRNETYFIKFSRSSREIVANDYFDVLYHICSWGNLFIIEATKSGIGNVSPDMTIHLFSEYWEKVDNRKDKKMATIIHHMDLNLNVQNKFGENLVQILKRKHPKLAIETNIRFLRYHGFNLKE